MSINVTKTNAQIMRDLINHPRINPALARQYQAELNAETEYFQRHYGIQRAVRVADENQKNRLINPSSNVYTRSRWGSPEVSNPADIAGNVEIYKPFYNRNAEEFGATVVFERICSEVERQKSSPSVVPPPSVKISSPPPRKRTLDDTLLANPNKRRAIFPSGSAFNNPVAIKVESTGINVEEDSLSPASQFFQTFPDPNVLIKSPKLSSSISPAPRLSSSPRPTTEKRSPKLQTPIPTGPKSWSSPSPRRLPEKRSPKHSIFLSTGSTPSSDSRSLFQRVSTRERTRSLSPSKISRSLSPSLKNSFRDIETKSKSPENELIHKVEAAYQYDVSKSCSPDNPHSSAQTFLSKIDPKYFKMFETWVTSPAPYPPHFHTLRKKLRPLYDAYQRLQSIR